MIFLNKNNELLFKNYNIINYMRFGSFSILLNKDEYSQFNINNGGDIEDTNKPLFKITLLTNGNMGDITHINFLNKNNDYVVKIFKEKYLINISNKLLIDFLKNGIKKYDEYRVNKIFNSNLKNELNLKGYFLENMGDIDLFDTLTHLFEFKTNIWIIDTNIHIYNFFDQMCKTLEYLQLNGIIHLDIKPENIIYNNKILIPFEKRFKLADFGFADKYPFKRYRNKFCGSVDYAPYYNDSKNKSEWCLNNKTNDWLFDTTKKKYIHYVDRNNFKPELIYKTDVYSMGIVFNQLLYYINNYIKHKNMDIFDDNKAIDLINNMTHKDIKKRFYAIDCIKFLKNEDKKENSIGCYKKIFNCWNK